MISSRILSVPLFHTFRISIIQSKLDMKNDQVLEERKRRREDVAKEIAKRKVVQGTVDDLCE